MMNHSYCFSSYSPVGLSIAEGAKDQEIIPIVSV